MRLLSVDARSVGGNRQDLARLVESAGADVACVHGGPHLLRWRSISAALGRRSGLVVVGGGRPAGANLLLSTLGVDALGSQDLPLPGGTRLHPAGAALALLRLRGTQFVLVGANLTGNAARRVAQAGELQRAIDRLAPGNPPAILSALGVDRSGTAAWHALAEDRVAVAGRVFVGGRIAIGESHELDGAANLRVPPVVVELTV
jgi:hypothetical protein